MVILVEKEFSLYDFSGSNAITHEGIAKHFKNVKSWQAIAELIWNGFDAGASEVQVSITETTAGGTEYLTVLDNGSGIEFRESSNNFKRFNDSLKTSSYDTHGSQGRGRLAFSKICNHAEWYTRHHGEDALITITSSNLSKVSGKQINSEDIHPLLAHCTSGTCVELKNFTTNLPPTDSLVSDFSKEFGGHLILRPHKSLLLNDIKILPQEHLEFKTSIDLEVASFDVRLIRWKEKPGNDKSYTYFVTNDGKVLHRMHSSGNKKPEYYISIYVNSPYFERYTPNSDSLSEPINSFLQSKLGRSLDRKIKSFIAENYASFLISQAEDQVARYESEGDFPVHPELGSAERTWRLSYVKEIIKSVIIKEPTLFVGSNKKQRRVIIRLLDRLAVSNENSGIFDIIESILDLDAATMKTFANQINKTKLENIVNTIEVLQKRETAIQQIKEIMDVHYKDVLETPHLQGIIENNTWLFGASYEILGAEEDSFTKAAESLRKEIKNIEDVDVGDLASGVTVEGAKKQVDLLLVRRQPQYDPNGDKYYRCVIVEIKRPGVALNDKHLQQLDQYASIISKYPAFQSDLTRFELILIGRTISAEAFNIGQRLESNKSHGEPGIITKTAKVKAYIKHWPRIFDEFNLTNDFLLENLKTQRADLSKMTKEDLLADLTAQA
nr:ATP-binding protein [Pseudomonas sp. PNPG3]